MNYTFKLVFVIKGGVCVCVSDSCSVTSNSW